MISMSNDFGRDLKDGIREATKRNKRHTDDLDAGAILLSIAERIAERAPDLASFNIKVPEVMLKTANTVVEILKAATISTGKELELRGDYVPTQRTQPGANGALITFDK